ncbi:protein FAM228B-like isoform X2 [Ambystoma mexicanum]|uniref:protein FAM228B-like isoform X2 n=1 Tax=Ambystoma mexicanum TaxID=8296 RepID=UPI0037E75338
MEEDSLRKPGSAMSSSFPDGVGEGIITLHLKEGQADDIMKELLPLPEDCDPEASRVPKKSSSSSVSGISPCFKRKPFDWLVQKQLSNAQALMNKENYRVNAATKSLLNTELHYVKEFDKYLRQREMLELRKKELQYKKWLERVSVPLLKSIDNYTDQQSNDEIENRRRKAFDQYLDYRNKKGYAFLEIYNPSEYNPFLLQLCKTYLKVSTPPLHDPLLRQLRDRFEEEGIALQCETGKE